MNLPVVLGPAGPPPPAPSIGIRPGRRSIPFRRAFAEPPGGGLARSRRRRFGAAVVNVPHR
jgi:hypothetical protein